MRNIIIGLTFIILIVMSLMSEPLDDVFDTMAGGTNPTYELTIDSFAAVSSENDDDDDDDEEDDDEEDDD